MKKFFKRKTKINGICVAREEICNALKENFGEKNPDVKVQ